MTSDLIKKLNNDLKLIKIHSGDRYNLQIILHPEDYEALEKVWGIKYTPNSTPYFYWIPIYKSKWVNKGEPKIIPIPSPVLPSFHTLSAAISDMRW